VIWGGAACEGRSFLVGEPSNPASAGRLQWWHSFRGRTANSQARSTNSDAQRRFWSKEWPKSTRGARRPQFRSLMPGSYFGWSEPRRSSPGGCASHREVHAAGSDDARAPSGLPKHRDRPALPSRTTGTRFELGTCGTRSWRACARARPPRRTNRGHSAHTEHVPASPDRCPIPRDAPPPSCRV